MLNIRDFINEQCIYRSPPGSRELISLEGKVSKWQFYLRAVTLNPVYVAAIAADFWSRFGERYKQEPFQLTGVDASALPIMSAITAHAFRLDGTIVHSFSIRKARKTYGLRNIFEGKPDPTLPVMFIDDLTSRTHLTFWHTINQLALHNLQVFPRGYVIVYKALREAVMRTLPTVNGSVTFDYMFDLTDFDMDWVAYQEAQASSRDVHTLLPIEE